MQGAEQIQRAVGCLQLISTLMGSVSSSTMRTEGVTRCLALSIPMTTNTCHKRRNTEVTLIKGQGPEEVSGMVGLTGYKKTRRSIGRLMQAGPN